jgi:hypothetical protein
MLKTMLGFTLAALIAVITLVALGATPDRVEAKQAATYSWHIGDGSPISVAACALPQFTCPIAAEAANGDTLEIGGVGTLTTHPQTATGGGTWTHRDAAGNVLGGGTWVATKLLTFADWGPGDAVPADWRAGHARMKVEFRVGAVVVTTGVMDVICLLPGANSRGSATAETVHVNINGPLNFHWAGNNGPTLFIRE